jgi:uncharacterized membrane protein
MLKRVSVWAAVAVVLVLAVQFALRSRPPQVEAAGSGEPPRHDPPAVDLPEPKLPPSSPPPTAAPERAERAEAVANNQPAVTLGDARTGEGLLGDGSRRFMFRCADGNVFTVRAVANEANVSSPTVLGSEVLTLPQTDAASGVAVYAQADAALRIEGNAATLDIRGHTFADCTSDTLAAVAAMVNRGGVVFGASGHEPTWLLSVSLDKIELATDDGERRVTAFPYREPTIGATRSTYRTFVGTQELFVVIDRVPCNDTLSGRPFNATVAVTFDGATLYGCGGFPWGNRARP